MLDKEKRIPVGLLTWRSFRDVCVVCFILVVTWKVLNSEISFNVGNLEYSDFLSTAIAFFSIGLSVAFYFKATDTSNQFYDNSYKFTKQISEMLGRIEAGFGEKLTHIDEGYSGLKQKIDQMPFDSVRANEQVREETQKVEQTEEAQKKNIRGSREASTVGGRREGGAV
ncbi:hypothetical protein [Teredinibacter turnerae]|uniref:hypothetical protein n=1 Tax=Teredinibacter turnerae TaxID=2426 RepID=UPI0030D29D76